MSAIDIARGVDTAAIVFAVMAIGMFVLLVVMIISEHKNRRR